MKPLSLLRCRKFLPLSLFCLAAAAGSAHGQDTNVDRARLLRSQTQIQPVGVGTANGVDQNYAAASPNDPDLGEQAILKRVEKYAAFTLEVGVPFYYTSNVALVNHGEMGDVITAPVVGITYAPKFQQTLYGEL